MQNDPFMIDDFPIQNGHAPYISLLVDIVGIMPILYTPFQSHEIPMRVERTPVYFILFISNPQTKTNACFTYIFSTPRTPWKFNSFYI